MSALSSTRAELINEAHRAGNAAAIDALEHYYQAGVLLNEQKAELPHGGWLPWLEANFKGDPRTAQRYMRLADNWPALKANATQMSHLSLSKALVSLTEPKALEAEKPGDLKDFLPQHGFAKMPPSRIWDDEEERRGAIIMRDPRYVQEDVYLYGTTELACIRPLYADGVFAALRMDGWEPLDEWETLPAQGADGVTLYMLYFEQALNEPWHRLPTLKDFPESTPEAPRGFRALRESVIPALEAAQSLLKIRDEKLYRGKHKTFEDYCWSRFKLEANSLKVVLAIAEPENRDLRDAAIVVMCEHNLTFEEALDYITDDFQEYLKGAA